MRILEASFKGLVLYCSALDHDRALDVVLVGKSVALILFAGWWEADWGTDGYAVVHGEFIEEPHGGAWTVKRTDDVLIYIAGPEDDEFIDRSLLNNRIGQRLTMQAWDGYVSQIKLMVTDDELQEPLAAWLELAAPKPGEDLMAEHLAKITALRSVAFIPMYDADGNGVDALVIDGFGHAATANNDPWLESMCSQWLRMDPEARTTIADFIRWVASKVPYSSKTLGPPVMTTAKGTVMAIALDKVPGGAVT